MDKGSKNIRTVVFSLVAVLLVLNALIWINVFSSTLTMRMDFTADKLYTLSTGTRGILTELPLEKNEQVQLRYYCSKGKVEMPVFLKSFSRRVDEQLEEHEKAADGKLEVERLNPLPTNNHEEKAGIDGVEGQMTQTGEIIYLGIAISFLDETLALPTLSPATENTLEYDLARAIYRVTHPERSTVGIMSSLPVMGAPAQNPMMGQRGTQPWYFVSELQKDYNVREIETTADVIPSDIDTLVMLHVKDITPGTEYAVDQFLMGGGKLVAFVDPISAVDQQNRPQQMGPPPESMSTLPRLFDAWGIAFDTDKMLMDNGNAAMFSSRQGMQPEPQPFILALGNKWMDQADITTNSLDQVRIAYAGVFEGAGAEGIERTVLLRSSGESMKVDKSKLMFGNSNIRNDYKASDKEHALAVKLTGRLKSAFPQGPPADVDTEDDEETDEPDNHLAEAAEDSAIILFADADMMFNDLWIRPTRSIFGQTVLQVTADNNNLLQNIVEQLSGSSHLIAIRSRTITSRPFELIDEKRAEAEKERRAEVKKYNEELQETDKKIREMRSAKAGTNQQFVRSAEEDEERLRLNKKRSEAVKTIRKLEKEMYREVDKIEKVVTWTNILAMPAAVFIVGIIFWLFKRRRGIL
jgi:ABC-type uncharacterized transport system involved in gliding motility auxiliary subunit